MYWLTPNAEVARIIKVIVGATFKVGTEQKRVFWSTFKSLQEIDSVAQICQPEVEVLVDVAHSLPHRESHISQVPHILYVHMSHV